MPPVPSVIALVFDFDGTLMPDASNMFLESRNIDTAAFWEQANHRIKNGWDQTLAWLDLFLAEVRPGGALEGLTEADLRAFGATLDPQFFPGVRELFAELKAQVRAFPLTSIEFYIISGGLKPIISACPTVRDHIDGVYACEFGTDDRGVLRGIKRAVTFTEKTRYLFEIHKGLSQAETENNPYLVNTQVELPDRRIPFAHMIFVGDSVTDIPCFSLVQHSGGHTAGIADLSRSGSAKTIFEQLIAPQRAGFGFHVPAYRSTDQLGITLRLAVNSIAGDITARRTARASRPGP